MLLHGDFNHSETLWKMLESVDALPYVDKSWSGISMRKLKESTGISIIEYEEPKRL
jgi:hypothetical protein